MCISTTFPTCTADRWSACARREDPGAGGEVQRPRRRLRRPIDEELSREYYTGPSGDQEQRHLPRGHRGLQRGQLGGRHRAGAAAPGDVQRRRRQLQRPKSTRASRPSAASRPAIPPGSAATTRTAAAASAAGARARAPREAGDGASAWARPGREPRPATASTTTATAPSTVPSPAGPATTGCSANATRTGPTSASRAAGSSVT